MNGTKTKEMTTFAKSITKLDQYASFVRAMIIAAEHGGMLPSRIEFIKALKDPKQHERFRGDLYWLRDEEEPYISGCGKIDYENGDILKISESEYWKLPNEQRAYVWKGPGHLAIVVNDNARSGTDRLGFHANLSPLEEARVAFVKLDGMRVATALDVGKGEMLEVTLHDGQKKQIDAAAARVVKRP